MFNSTARASQHARLNSPIAARPGRFRQLWRRIAARLSPSLALAPDTHPPTCFHLFAMLEPRVLLNGSIAGMLWHDANGNDMRDTAEALFAGVTVYVDIDNNGALDWIDGDADNAWDDGEGERWTVSDADGSYRIDGLSDGQHVVRPIAPASFQSRQNLFKQASKLTAADAEAYDYFGESVAISGNVAVVGAIYDDGDSINGTIRDSGAAYVFDVTTGEQLFKLTADDASEGDYFGSSVAISGNIAIVGAIQDDEGSGSAYIFDVTTGDQLFKLHPENPAEGGIFGSSVAISGNIAIVGAPRDDDGSETYKGSAYVFDVTTGELIASLRADDVEVGGEFGASVAIDGPIAVVGALNGYDGGPSDLGAAYVFDLTTGQQLARLAVDDAPEGEHFARTVAISGGIVAVGASGNEDAGDSSGAVYLFDVTTRAMITKLTAADATADAHFGKSVAISDNAVLVGAHFDDDRGTNSGSAYLFDVATAQQFAKITGADTVWLDNFGGSVAISSNAAIVGAAGNDHAGEKGGAAYLFIASAGRQVTTSDGALTSVNFTFQNPAPTVNNAAVSVREDITPDVAIASILARDFNGDTLIYTIAAGNDEGLFTIDAATGAISLAAGQKLDFETATRHVLTVQVTDSSGSAATAKLTITVTHRWTFQVPENLNAITTILIGDFGQSDTLAYSLSGGADANLFDIDASGTLAFKATPNYESPGDADADNVHRVQVQISDGALDVTEDLTIIVTDVNEVPWFASNATVRAPENQISVATVVARDHDADARQIYSLSGGSDAALFEIDRKSGALTFKAAPNFDAPGDADADNVYHVQVHVTDGVHSIVQDLVVTVIDVDGRFTAGTLWHDLDGDRVRDPEEDVFTGVAVYIDKNDNGALDWSDADGDEAWDDGEGERWVVTGDEGHYIIDGLIRGEHVVRPVVPAGYNSVRRTYESTAKLTLSDLVGVSDAIYAAADVSGAIAVIGVTHDDNDGRFGGFHRGSAYVVNLTSGDVITSLRKKDAVRYDEFGRFVAISGNFAVVEALGTNSIYVFDTVTGEQITQITNAAGMLFPMGISGTHVIAMKTSDIDEFVSETVVYDIVTGEQVAVLIPDDNAEYLASWESSALDGDIAIVAPAAASSAYLFDIKTGDQLARLPLGDLALPSGSSGTATDAASVAIHGDTAIVGVSQAHDGAGAAFLFDVETGELIATLAGDPSWFERFGISVAINDNIAVVNNGYRDAYIFDVKTGERLAKISANAWTVDIDGDVIVAHDGLQELSFIHGREGRIVTLDRAAIGMDFAFQMSIAKEAPPVMRVVKAGSPLEYTDTLGNLVTIGMTGPGSGIVTFNPGEGPGRAPGIPLRIEFDGTDMRTRVVVNTAAGVRTQLSEFIVMGDLGVLNAPGADLLGNLAIEGHVGTLVLGNVANSDLALGGTASHVTSLHFQSLQDTVIESGSGIRSFVVRTGWTDTDAAADTIAAPWVWQMVVAGPMQASLDLSGTGGPSGYTLGALTAGSIQGGVYDLDAGSIGMITASGIMGLSVEATSGMVGRIVSRGSVSAFNLHAASLNSLAIVGDLSASDLDLIGRHRLALTQFVVTGSVSQTVIASTASIGSITATGIDGLTLDASAGAIGRLVSHGNVSGLTVQADRLGVLAIVGNLDSSDVDLSTMTGVGLAQFVATGSVSQTAIASAAGIGSITATGINGLTLEAASGAIGRMVSRGNVSGLELEAGVLNVLGIVGDLTGSDIRLATEGGTSIANLVVTGRIVGSTIESAGHVLAFQAGGMTDSRLFVGVTEQGKASPDRLPAADMATFITSRPVLVTAIIRGSDKSGLLRSQIAASRIVKLAVVGEIAGDATSASGVTADQVDSYVDYNSVTRMIRRGARLLSQADADNQLGTLPQGVAMRIL